MKPVALPERDENDAPLGFRGGPILKGLLSRLGLAINTKTCFDGLSTSGLRVHFKRVFPLTLSLSKGVSGENRQSQPGEGTHGRHEAAGRTNATPSQQIFETGEI